MTTVVNVRGRDRLSLLADPDFVYVGRGVGRAGWKGSIWGNPFKVGMDPFVAMRVLDSLVQHGHARISGRFVIDGPLTLADVVEWYETYVRMDRRLWGRLAELKGKKLGCFCCDFDGHGEPSKPCHAVVLARLADEMGGELR